MKQLPRFLSAEQAFSETCQWQIHDHLSAAGRKRERVRSEAVLVGETFGAGSAELVAVPDDDFHSSQGPSIRSFPSPVFADITAANRLTCGGSFPLGRLGKSSKTSRTTLPRKRPGRFTSEDFCTIMSASIPMERRRLRPSFLMWSENSGSPNAGGHISRDFPRPRNVR